jgi:hypothetical protein
MRAGIRRIPSLVAIYAIAMHTILWGAGPLSAAPTVDPLSIICHSAASDSSPGQHAPVDPDRVPTHACDHCNLCSAIAPPAALDDIVAGHLAPARVFDVLRPASTTARSSLAFSPKLARAPPTFA